MPRWFIGLYALLWGLVLPFALLRLLWRSRRNPAYRRHWGERLGLGAAPAADLWIHAVSVGEARAAAPLVRALCDEGRRVLITCTTPTGRATLESLFGDHDVAIRYLPFDAPWLIGPWVRRTQAQTILLVETELWPGLCHAARREARTLVLVNARLSEKSATGYRRAGHLGRALIGTLSAVGAQSTEDAERFTRLGARSVTVTGNLKFDLALPDDLATRAARLRTHVTGGRERPIWVAASTREGEEARLLGALARHALRERALAVVVPRHPERWDAVTDAARSLGFRVARRSERHIPSDAQVVIGDSMGEMFAWYANAFAVVMGGTLGDTGGQNLIEPCALGVPVVLGPSTYNFAQAAEAALSAGAAVRVSNPDEAIAQVAEWLGDPVARAGAGDAARNFVAHHRGATARTCELIRRMESR